MATCKFWAKGTCQYGDSCRFEHVGASGSGGGGAGGQGGEPIRAARAGGGGTAPRPPQLCKFFSQGRCSRGEGCRFSHSVGSPGASLPSSPGYTAPLLTGSGHWEAQLAQGMGGMAIGGGVVGGQAPRHSAAPLPVVIDLPQGTMVYSIDVECVATGTLHNDRSIAQISLVDGASNVLANLYVKPDVPVVSHLTPLTGVTAELLDERGSTLEAALSELRRRLPPNSVLVGQNILKDVQWLGLREGVDFTMMVDLAGLLKVWNPASGRYVYFGLDHYAKVWIGAARGEGEAHDAVDDAVKSVQVFNAYQRVMRDPAAVAAIGARALTTPVTPSFAKQHPTFEGVCQGNKKTCACGAPFYS